MRLAALRKSLIAFLVSCFHPGFCLHSQNASGALLNPPKGAQHLSFEVSSVRPSAPGATPTGFSITQDGYKQGGMPLVYAIMMAYLPMANISTDRVKNAPDWVFSDRYDIIGKISSEDAPEWTRLNQSRISKPMLEPMLQALLADRFGLSVETIFTEASGYSIEATKKKLRLTATRANGTLPTGAIPIAGGGFVKPPTKADSEQKVAFYGVSMDALASYLSQYSHGKTVVNRTGIVGKFDFVLPAQPQEDTTQEEPDEVLWDVTAVGLKLSRVMVPGQPQISILSIHRPTPN